MMVIFMQSDGGDGGNDDGDGDDGSDGGNDSGGDNGTGGGNDKTAFVQISTEAEKKDEKHIGLDLDQDEEENQLENLFLQLKNATS